MKSTKSRVASSPNDKRRAKRARPTPKWLAEQQDLNEMARRRTLLVLSVLSGEKAVTEAISEAGISRALYYQLETKALQAVLRALAPGSSEPSGNAGADGMLRRISELEEQVAKLSQEKRRTDRLLFLTRKVVKKGPIAAEGRGRPRGRSSTTTGPKSSQASSSPLMATASASPNSTPTPAGATMP
jgi:hypothetical protein